MTDRDMATNRQEMRDVAFRLRQLGASALVADSRQLQAGQAGKMGQAFVAWPGYGVDARQFVAAALAAGAAACVVEAEGAEGWNFQDARIFFVQNLNSFIFFCASSFDGLFISITLISFFFI